MCRGEWIRHFAWKFFGHRVPPRQLEKKSKVATLWLEDHFEVRKNGLQGQGKNWRTGANVPNGPAVIKAKTGCEVPRIVIFPLLRGGAKKGV